MNSTNELTQKFGLPNEANVDFRALIYNFWENKFLILTITFVIVTLSTLYTIFRAPQFETNILIQVNNRGSGSFNLFQQFGITNSGGADESAAQIALIKSRFILEPVVNQLGLALHIKPRHSLLGKLFSHSNEYLKIKDLTVPPTYYDEHLKFIVNNKTHFHLVDKNGKLLIQGTVGKLITNHINGVSLQVEEINASPGTEFDVIKSSSTSVITNIIPNLHVEELGEGTAKTNILQISLKDTNPLRSVSILNAIANLIQTKDKERKWIETTQTLDFLQRQLPLAKSSLEQAEGALNQYRATTGKIDIKLESQALLMQLNNVEKEITTTILNKANLLQNYTPKHPFIMEINDKLVELQKQKLILEKQVKSLPATDQVMVNLMRDVQIKNKLYLVLLSQIQALEINKAGTASDIRILSLATPPDGPLSKQTCIVMAASLFLGLILGCLVVLIRKAFLRHVNDPHWIEQHLNVINLAIIPYSKQQAKNMNSFKTKEKNSISILAEKNPRDLSLEALRSLRTSFQIVLAGASNNIVMLTGISPATGKSFICVNFSCLLAELGKRILLIDGDIRKGYLHNYFKTSRSPGLSELLTGKTTLENAIKKTPFNTLSFLPSGNFPQNPAELLMGENFKNLMKILSQQFDLVIIDTAPILAVTDSAVIGSLTGTNLVVIGSNSHQAEEITLAFKRLDNAGVKIQGTIFNHLKQETAVYGNYQYNYHDETVT